MLASGNIKQFRNTFYGFVWEYSMRIGIMIKHLQKMYPYQQTKVFSVIFVVCDVLYFPLPSLQRFSTFLLSSAHDVKI
jgi:hypothetical protein